MVQETFAKEIRVAAAPAAAWAALLDFPRVASWLKVVADLREIEPMRRYGAVLADRVGPFTLRADLAVSVDASPERRHLRVTASGEDRQVASRISATIELAVSDDGPGSALRVDGRYEITGKVATLGASAIRKKGERVLDEFCAALARDLGGAAA